ncbi:MAG TPA: ATP-dependent protease, Lon family [Firmicutes bacterium]|jgi:ATP-dependent Lon protease|nr:ATP-dependent protease, Lon family [Bacillota bacterium]HOQ24425.1 Lon family ATP-dependent protease [Bacillota bacterium]HPT68110.1 Lon family ATP-dependent protease [Bacillota bacterium]
MKGIMRKMEEKDREVVAEQLPDEDQLRRQVAALYALLSNIIGTDKLILKAGKLEALKYMRSEDLGERVLALQRLVFEDPTLDEAPAWEDIPRVLNEIEEEIADLIARRTVEEKIEKKIAEKMQQRHEDYVKEIKMQVLKETSGPDNPQTLKKLAELEHLDTISLSASMLETLKPTGLDQVVGQERAIKALLTKIASPYPQHVILYGPPGVGKTTVARLVLEVAKKLKYTPFAEDAKFVEVDGTTLRWDPREVTNPLLGSVHDPIYQGARRDMAESGIPEPKLGLVTEAHGGVLFMDEIGELDPMLMNKLLKVLEDKRVYFDSSYYDPQDPNVPKYIRKLFEEGAPADFVLIAATTRDPSDINPALRSRCAEVFFEPLTRESIQRIVKEAAERLHATISPEVPELISQYTEEGRKAVGLLADAYGMALYRQNSEETPMVLVEDVMEVIRVSRLTPNVLVKATDTAEIGKIFGLGVYGFQGSVLEIEASCFPAAEKGKGKLRFNETAGSMAKDSVFNAASVIRLVTGLDLADYDAHVNVIGGGRIDGPSAGVAITLALISCLQKRPIRQNVAVTGEISIQGKIKAVGGVFEKIYGARQAGIKQVFIPRENEKDVPADSLGVEVVPVDTIMEILDQVLLPQ